MKEIRCLLFFIFLIMGWDMTNLKIWRYFPLMSPFEKWALLRQHFQTDLDKNIWHGLVRYFDLIDNVTLLFISSKSDLKWRIYRLIVSYGTSGKHKLCSMLLGKYSLKVSVKNLVEKSWAQIISFISSAKFDMVIQKSSPLYWYLFCSVT